MVGNSDSKTTNITEEFIFNNADYSGGGGESASVAKNINLAKSDLTTGDINITDGGVAKAGIAATGESFKQLLETSEQLVGDGYEGLKGTQEFAKDSLARAVNFASSANQGISEQLDRVLSYANESTRSDTSQAFENVAKYGLIAAAVTAGAYFWTKG